MSNSDDGIEESSEHSFEKVKQRLKDRSKKVVETKENAKKIISEHADRIAKQAEEHERFINKVTYLLGVLGFGGFCFILGARPQDIPYVYCLFYVTFVPLRWIYYRYKKWHYYLLMHGGQTMCQNVVRICSWNAHFSWSEMAFALFCAWFKMFGDDGL